MATNLICIHHSGCLDRPAVGTCSKCGRGLCAECSTKFKSSKTGKSLCVECFNEELLQTKNELLWFEKYTKKEQRRMIIGSVLMGIVGLLFFIIFLASDMGGLGVLLAFVSLIWFPCFGGSYVTIHKSAWDFSDITHGIFRVLVFIPALIVLIAISPVMFIYRLVSRIKLRKKLVYIADYNQRAKEANDKFLLMARTQRSSRNGTDTLALMNQIAELKKQLETAHTNNNTQDVSSLQKRIEELEQAQQTIQQTQQAQQSDIDEVRKAGDDVAACQEELKNVTDMLQAERDRLTPKPKKKK